MGYNAIRIFLDENRWHFERLGMLQNCLISECVFVINREITRCDDRVEMRKFLRINHYSLALPRGIRRFDGFISPRNCFCNCRKNSSFLRVSHSWKWGVRN
jgi:hypothetical protein